MAHPVDLNTNLLRLVVDDSGVATVWIDDPSASVNTISRDTLDGFSEVLGLLEQWSDLLGVVFISAKEASFIVGADLDMLQQIDNDMGARICLPGPRRSLDEQVAFLEAADRLTHLGCRLAIAIACHDRRT